LKLIAIPHLPFHLYKGSFLHDLFYFCSPNQQKSLNKFFF
jgi:hypothetical protein